jgi:hypothetical protein
MERAVVWRGSARIPARAITGANGRERKRETGRSESVPTPVEM